MFKFKTHAVIVSALLSAACSYAAPAWALSPLTFVSGKGVDSGTCASPANPCRTFQYAHDQTVASGEIKALDPANYFAVAITKSIAITGVDGAGVIRGSDGDAIAITAGAAGVVSVTGLTIDGFNQNAAHGVRLNSAAQLTIKNCVVRNFHGRGIAIFPTAGTSKFLIEDTVLVNGGERAILITGDFGGAAEGVIRRVAATKSQNGITVGHGAIVSIVDSVASNNSSTGFEVANGTMRLSHSVSTGNNFGFFHAGQSTAESAGDNFIRGNASANIGGALTNVGTQ